MCYDKYYSVIKYVIYKSFYQRNLLYELNKKKKMYSEFNTV